MEDNIAELKKEILELASVCNKCRFCLPSCPLFEITQHTNNGDIPTGVMEGEVSQGASGILQSLHHIVRWDIHDKKTLTELRDLLYSCTTCRNCELTCNKSSTGVKLMDVFHKGRELLLEEEIAPMPNQRKPLESLFRYGNPYGMTPQERKEWMEGLEVPFFTRKGEFDYLFYVGCTAPHDTRVGEMARAIVALFKKAGVSFGILEEENCCGSPALRMGDRMLFEDIGQKNLSQFASLEPGRIITLSPHCSDTFANKYTWPEAPETKVQHYTQFMAELVEQGKLSFKPGAAEDVVYQDPCYLGRHNDVYDAPRKVLTSIPGVKLHEFARSRANSMCCGGGGGRMWSDFDAEEDRMANIRVKDGLKTGAMTLVTACPFCLINLDDAVKSLDAEDSMRVKDLASLAAEHI